MFPIPWSKDTLFSHFKTVRKVTLYVYYIFLITNLIYFYFFSFLPISRDRMIFETRSYYGIFTYIANGDHFSYLYPIDTILNQGKSLGRISPHSGIVYFYYYLHKCIPLDYTILSFIVNNVVIVASYVTLIAILKRTALSTRYSWVFFCNPQLVYYSQLMNKESLTLLSVLLMVYFVSTRRNIPLVVTTLASMVIRQWLGLFAFFLWWLYNARNYRIRIMHLYVITAFLAAYISITASTSPNLDLQTSTLQMLIHQLNNDYGIGTLLLAPLRIVQFIYLQLLSIPNSITSNGLISLYHAQDVLPVMIIIILGERLSRIFMNMRIYFRRGERVFLSPIIAFTFVLLLYPYSHQRYFFPVIVLLIQMGLSHMRYRGSYAETEYADDAVDMDVKSALARN